MEDTRSDGGVRAALRTVGEVTKELAHSPVEADSQEIPAMIVDAVPGVVAGAEAGIMLVDPRRGLSLLRSSSEHVSLVELFEIQISQGPCPESCESGEEVLDQPLGRWPRLEALATQQGFEQASAFPLTCGAATVGAMNVFLDEPRGLRSWERDAVRVLADLAALALARERSETTIAQLQRALDSRVVIEQAKGALSQRLGIGPNDAFEKFRAHARSRNLKLVDVGQEIIDGKVPAELAS